MDTYWHTILRCWRALEEEITKERNHRGNPGYMKNFQELYDLANKYREKKYPEVQPTFL